MFRNVNLNNLENVLQRNLRTDRARGCILEHLEAESKNLLGQCQL